MAGRRNDLGPSGSAFSARTASSAWSCSEVPSQGSVKGEPSPPRPVSRRAGRTGTGSLGRGRLDPDRPAGRQLRPARPQRRHSRRAHGRRLVPAAVDATADPDEHRQHDYKETVRRVHGNQHSGRS